jgi:hypothetical protein
MKRSYQMFNNGALTGSTVEEVIAVTVGTPDPLVADARSELGVPTVENLVPSEFKPHSHAVMADQAC